MIILHGRSGSAAQFCQFSSAAVRHIFVSFRLVRFSLTNRGSPTFKAATDTTVDSSTDFFSEEQSDQPHLQFLQDFTRELSMLNKHTAVKSVFLRFNSVIPSSAPVQRLSTAAIILSKRRNCLNDDIFEKLMLLKLNKDFW